MLLVYTTIFYEFIDDYHNTVIFHQAIDSNAFTEFTLTGFYCMILFKEVSSICSLSTLQCRGAQNANGLSAF